MQRIGFIGLDLMGQPISRRLLEAGHPLTVWNPTAEKARDLLAAGAACAASPRTVAQASDVVITIRLAEIGGQDHLRRRGGAGTTLKLVNNLILGVAIEAVAEVLVPATKAGRDLQSVIEITSVGGARTGAMETRGPRMAKRDFSPHFSTNNMYKDVSPALSFAEACGVSLPAASISREILGQPGLKARASWTRASS